MTPTSKTGLTLTSNFPFSILTPKSIPILAWASRCFFPNWAWISPPAFAPALASTFPFPALKSAEAPAPTFPSTPTLVLPICACAPPEYVLPAPAFPVNLPFLLYTEAYPLVLSWKRASAENLVFPIFPFNLPPYFLWYSARASKPFLLIFNLPLPPISCVADPFTLFFPIPTSPEYVVDFEPCPFILTPFFLSYLIPPPAFIVSFFPPFTLAFPIFPSWVW